MSHNLVSVSPDRRQKLDAMGCTYRFSLESSATTSDAKVVELIDLATDQSWNKTVGTEWQETFERAVDTAAQFSKPKTPAEIAQDAAILAEENQRLRAMVESAKASEPKKTAKTT